MTTLTAPSESTPAAPGRTYALGGLAFDWLMAGLGAWLIGGLFLDGWAHNHISQMESFFTPWHGVLYSGFMVCAAVLAGVFARNLRRGLPAAQALPHGYGLSLIGAGIFVAGGVGDMVWHIVFGIEIGVEALLSPTHLLLAIGGSLLITGPLRAGLRRSDSSGSLWPLLPMMISATTFYSILTFFTVFADPFATTWVGALDRPGDNQVYITQAVGVSSFLFHSALLAAFVLVLLRNNKLRPGALTFLLAINTGITVLINDVYLLTDSRLLVLAGLAAGMLGDLALWRLQPSIANVRSLRVFVSLLPATLHLFYFLAIHFSVGLWWSIHMWTGAVVISGLTGWLVSYLVLPAGDERVAVTPS